MATATSIPRMRNMQFVARLEVAVLVEDPVVRKVVLGVAGDPPDGAALRRRPAVAALRMIGMIGQVEADDRHHVAEAAMKSAGEAGRSRSATLTKDCRSARSSTDSR